MRAWSTTVGTAVAILVFGLSSAPAFASTDASLQLRTHLTASVVVHGGTYGWESTSCEDKGTSKAADKAARADAKAAKKAARAAGGVVKNETAQGPTHRAVPAKPGKPGMPAKPPKPAHAATPDKGSAGGSKGNSQKAHGSQEPRAQCETGSSTE